MVAAAVTAKAQKNLLLNITDPDGVSTLTYEKHVSSVNWEPTVQQQTWQGGTPDASLTDTSSPTWVANVTLVQDWDNPDSLCNFLLEHQGKSVAVTYKPDAAGEFSIQATITLVPPAIGGAVGVFNESTVQMGSTVPVPTFPAPAAP